MGLDGVELVMALEEAFGVELKDEEIFKAVTPRLVGDIIFSKLQATDDRVCQSQRAFYLLRKALVGLFGLKRQEVTLALRFRAFIPKAEEREIWPRLKQALSARSWPALARPRWLSRTLGAAHCALFVAGIYAAVYYGVGWIVGAFCGGVLVVLSSAMTTWLTAPCRLYFPARYQRVRDLIPLAVTSDQVKWTRGQVSETVKTVVMEQLGVSDAQYTEDAHFINDFHMG